MFGILNLAKPAGATSRDVVNMVQRLVRPAKVGHAGTLDPLATGVLIVCVGPATRLVETIHNLRKAYSATFLLGRSSDSGDIDEEVTERPDLPVPTREAIEAALPRFVGRILQTPPIYSAVKLDGKRAYQRARRGETVELAARPVDAYELRVRSYAYPSLEIDIVCGSGFYVRSLGRDLAREVGSDAVMSRLERTAIGPFTVPDAVDPRELSRDNLEARLQSPLAALVDYPRRICDSNDEERLFRGMSLVQGNVSPQDHPAAVAVNARGDLLALLTAESSGMWRPEKVFLTSGGAGTSG